MRSRTKFLVAGLALAVLMLASTTAHAATHLNNLRSGLKADVMWASQAHFQGVFLWPNNSSLSQEFELLQSGGGFFRIQARHSGQCLMLDWRQGNRNGTRVVQYPACGAGYAPAEWRRGWVGAAPKCSGNICSTTGTTYPVLVNRSTGRCLDANNPYGGAPGAQAVLQQWDCIRFSTDWNAGNQLWGFDNEGYL